MENGIAIQTEIRDKFFDSFEKYVSHIKHINRNSEKIREGLLVFMNFPGALSASLFLLNKELLEFEYRTGVPESKPRYSQELFSRLVAEEYIGAALEKGEIIEAELDAKYKIVPLLASQGINGIVVLEYQHSPNKQSFENARMLNVLAGFYAATLENTLLFRNLDATQASIEQTVAARTMSLTAVQRELYSIINSVHSGIMVVDIKTGKIEKVNTVALDYLGSQDEITVIGNPISNFMEEVEYRDDFDFEKQAILNNFESYLIKLDGSIAPIIRNVSSIFMGTVKYRIDSFVDISDRKRAEIALKQANELLELKVEERTLDLQLLIRKLKEEIEERTYAQNELKRLLDKEKALNELKTKFVSMVSHEFRTPLTVIRSAAQMLEKFKERLQEVERDEYYKRIVKTVDYMIDLIENIIFIEKNETGKIPASSTHINLQDYVGGLIDDFQLSLPIKRLINYHCIGFDDAVLTNEKLIRLILTNLLSNAVKYSSYEDPIEVNLYINDENYSLSVKDYGIGIPADDQERIFSLFYRSENVGKVSGAGIGLPVVLNSVQMLKGKISLESEQHKGSSFIVTIPRKFELEGVKI